MSVPSPSEHVEEVVRALRRELRWRVLSYDQMDILAGHGATPSAFAALDVAELADRLVAVGGWSEALEGVDRDARASWRWNLQLFTHCRMADCAELIERKMRDDPRFVATIVTPPTPRRDNAFSDLTGICQVDDEIGRWAIVAVLSRAAKNALCAEAIETLKKQPSDLALIAFVAEIAKVDVLEAERLLPHWPGSWPPAAGSSRNENTQAPAGGQCLGRIRREALGSLRSAHLSADGTDRVYERDAIPNADVAVVAGDICEGAVIALGFLARTIALRMPVVCALGNHEFYGEEYARVRAEAVKVARMIADLHLLDNSEAIIGGVRFVGGTLWTNYALYADGDVVEVQRAMRVAKHQLADHREIDVAGPEPGLLARRWSPADALKAHRESVAYIDRTLSRRHTGPTVVVSHHAPHPLSIAPRFRGDALTPAFVSDLSRMIERRRPSLWVHGHVHDRVDVAVGATRIICNPKGYFGETSNFDPSLVIEV